MIPRLPAQKDALKQLIRLCDDIKEPELKALFEKMATFNRSGSGKDLMEDLKKSDQLRSEITALLKKKSIKRGLSRLSQKLKTEGNFSVNIKDNVQRELREVMKARASKTSS